MWFQKKYKKFSCKGVEKMTKDGKSTRVISIYLKNRGIDTVLQECGNNLRAFKAHLRRVCSLPKTVKLYNIQQQAKAVLENRLDNYSIVVKAVDEFLENNFGGKNNG